MAAHTALYRRWRPHRFADVVGQEHVTRTLRNALRTGSTTHAYLFCGPRGTGKTSAARILAAALNCERPNEGDACGECAMCGMVAADRLLDVREVDAASNRQVEDVRALRETVGYAPSAGRHKVYILDEVHMLTDASWNTLLKTLEEPPPATTFVMCTTDPQHVLGTVASRCQRFDFRRLTLEEITAQLARVCEADGAAATAAGLEAVARRADGGLRDALGILEQALQYAAGQPLAAAHVADVLGAVDEETAADLLTATEAGAAEELFARVDALYAEGRDMAQVCRDLLNALRQRVVAMLGTAPRSRRQTPAAAPGWEWCLRALDVLSQAEGQMRRAPQPRLSLEIALLRLLPAAPSEEAAGTPAGGQAAQGSGPVAGGAPPKSRPAAAASGAARRVAGEPRQAARHRAPEGGVAGTLEPVAEASSEPHAGSESSGAEGGAGVAAAAGVGEDQLVAAARIEREAGARGEIAAAREPGTDGGSDAPEWSAVLDTVGRTDKVAHARLLSARFVGLEGQDLVVRVPHDSFTGMLMAKAQVIERAWAEAGGGSVRLRCEVQPESAESDRRAESVPPAESTPPHAQPRREARAAVDARPAGGDVRPRGRPDAQAAFQRALIRFDGTPVDDDG